MVAVAVVVLLEVVVILLSVVAGVVPVVLLAIIVVVVVVVLRGLCEDVVVALLVNGRGDVDAVTVLEKRIKLRSVALERGAFVKYFAERVLYDRDLVPDPDLSAQLVLQIGGR